jgi:hypothetical protein
VRDNRWGIHDGKLVTINESIEYNGQYYPKGIIFEHVRGRFEGQFTCLLFDTTQNKYITYAPKHANGVDSKNGVFKTQHQAILSFNKHLDAQGSPASTLITQNYLTSLALKGKLTPTEILSLSSTKVQ